MTEVEARPRFYEGQFLSAADLTAAVDYTRTQRARMLLGGHRWGIALGMDLMEVPGPNAVLDVVVQPGYAWDGFGRPIVVAEPARLSGSLFRRFDDLVTPGGPVPPPMQVEVWIRYDETLGQGPRPGFESCDLDSAYSRVTERFVIEVGPRSDIASRRDSIEIAGRSMDASQALKTFDPAAPELADASVPHQVLPEEGEHALWLVPLGVVTYQPGTPGKLVKRDPAALLRHARSREYAGVVAGSVEATGGVVRVHDRAKAYSANRTDELLCVEGDIRSDGDVRIFGRKLEFVASHSESPRLPMQVLRRDDPGAGTAALTLVIGDKQAGNNKLVVARKSGATTYDSKMVVTDKGNVGIGTETPKAPLHVIEQGLQIGTGTPQDKNFQVQSNEAGGPRALRFLNGDFGSGTPLMSLTATGRLGIGEADPKNMLHVKGSLGIRQNAMYLSGDSRWSSLTFNAFHNASNTAWEFPDTSKPAVTIEMDAIDGFPRFEVWATQPGGGNQLWQSRLLVNGHTGNVGIGTRSPAARLDVSGDLRVSGAAEVLGNLRFAGLDAVGAGTRVRVVWGAVDTTGTIEAGQGFTVTKEGTGRYRLTWATPFAGQPTIVATRVHMDLQTNAGASVTPGATAVVDYAVAGSAIVATANPAGALADGSFTFIAIGPR
jgi:hypothetical protein